MAQVKNQINEKKRNLDDNQRFGNEDFAIDERSKEDGLDDEAVDIISAESTKKPTNVTTHGAYQAKSS